MFCIHASALGAKKHLVFDDTGADGTWVSDTPASVPVYTGKFKTSDCFDTMLRLAASDAQLSFPDEYKIVSRQVFGDTDPMWSMLLPTRVFKSCVVSFVAQAVEAKADVIRPYYDGTWRHVSDFLETLVPCSAGDGELRRISYSRLSTRTGRMIVTSGAPVLTMRSDLRSTLRTDVDSPLFYVDFRALEPTIIANTVGAKFSGSDLYEWLASNVLTVSDRAAAKRAVVIALYNTPSARTRDAKALAEWFRLDDLATTIRAMSIDQRRVTNAYGRLIMSDDFDDDGCVINDFAQSTAVDAAVLGFDMICRSRDVRPLAIIHDAVIVQDQRGVLSDGEIGHVDVDTVGRLYYKVSRIK